MVHLLCSVQSVSIAVHFLMCFFHITLSVPFSRSLPARHAHDGVEPLRIVSGCVAVRAGKQIFLKYRAQSWIIVNDRINVTFVYFGIMLKESEQIWNKLKNYFLNIFMNVLDFSKISVSLLWCPPMCSVRFLSTRICVASFVSLVAAAGRMLINMAWRSVLHAIFGQRQMKKKKRKGKNIATKWLLLRCGSQKHSVHPSLPHCKYR